MPVLTANIKALFVFNRLQLRLPALPLAMPPMADDPLSSGRSV
jgi:hypothetical protein